MIEHPPACIVSSSALEITDAAQQKATDMVAAFASCLGHRHPAVVRAITAAIGSHLGSNDALAPANLAAELGEPFSAYADVCLVPSASEANEWAIRLARAAAGAQQPEDSASGPRYRIVTLLGGDHGDTLACRSASGRLADQAAGGPLMAGFRHITAGDMRAVDKAVDATTAAVLLAPVDWTQGGEAFDGEYLLEIRRICDASGALLIIDETRLPPAISGRWWFYQAQAHGLQPDIVTASAGWTGGLPGGVLLIRETVLSRLSSQAGAHGPQPEGSHDAVAADLSATAAGEPFSLRKAGLLPERDYPVLRAIVQATALAVQELGGPEQLGQIAQAWTEGWHELANDFEFVRDATTTGLWTVIQLDLPADEVAAAVGKLGLRLLSSGETTLLACPPINVTAPQMAHILGTFRAALETIERQTIES